MAQVVVFHHALGLTDGVAGFAAALRRAGHVVHTPDLYEGERFPSISAGVAHAEEVGFDVIVERGTAAVAGLPDGLVLVGFSLGALPAQKLAQTRPGARGAVLCHSVASPAELGGPWPAGLPVQVHLTAGDPWAEEDAEAARALRDETDAVEVFAYPGSAHLFAEPGLPDYDPDSAGLLLRRILEFLTRVG